MEGENLFEIKGRIVTQLEVLQAQLGEVNKRIVQENMSSQKKESVADPAEIGGQKAEV